jgi:PAS domain-containing protein
MDTNEIHEKLIKGVAEQQKEILESSGQAIYIYLDDNHVVYNQRFASLLSYSSPQELDKFKGSFLLSFVAEQSQNTLANAYQKAMDKKEGSTVEIFWKKKSGGEIRTTVMLTPTMFDGHLFAFHFIS